MLRYRKEVKIWKDKKEREAEASSTGLVVPMNTSFSSIDTEFRLNGLPSEGHMQEPVAGACWQPSRNPSSLHDSLNSSYVFTDPRESEHSIEPMPLNTNTMQLQMQMQMQMHQMQIQQMQIQQQQGYHPHQHQHQQHQQQYQQQHQQHQQHQQQHYPHVYQQQQAHPQASFIANANQGSMTSFPAMGGSYGNASFNIMAPGNYGNASTNSMAQHDSLLGVSSSQVSDYTSNHTSGYDASDNFESSYTSGNSSGYASGNPWGPR